MDFWELTVILARRWYVFVPALLLTLGATFLLGQRVEPTYEAQASVLVAGPGDELGEGNPFANSETAARALTVIMESPEAVASVDSLSNAGDGIDYIVTNVSHTAIIQIFIDAATVEEAIQGAAAVVTILRTRLDEAQESVGANQPGRSNLVILSPPVEATPSTAGRMRVLIAGGGVSVLLALTLTLGTEGYQRRRRQAPVAVSKRGLTAGRAA